MARDIEAFVEKLAKDLEEDRRRGSTEVTRRLVSSILYQCGWQKRSPERLEDLENQLANASLFADPDITEMCLALDTWVKFTPNRRLRSGGSSNLSALLDTTSPNTPRSWSARCPVSGG